MGKVHARGKASEDSYVIEFDDGKRKKLKRENFNVYSYDTTKYKGDKKMHLRLFRHKAVEMMLGRSFDFDKNGDH